MSRVGPNTAGVCPMCNMSVGETDVHYCAAANDATAITYVSVPSYEDRIIEQLKRIADALERLSG